MPPAILALQPGLSKLPLLHRFSMTYLVLSALVYVYNALVLKWGEMRKQDRIVVMGVNYVCATLTAAVFWLAEGNAAPSVTTVVLGLMGGAFYAASLLLWMVAIAQAGLAISTAAMRLSVLWPTALSIVVFGEIPTRFQLAGVALAFGVLLLLTAGALTARRVSLSETGLYALLAVFVVSGGTGSTQKLFTELAGAADRNALLTVIFATAAVGCWLWILAGRHRFSKGDVLRGMMFGVGNLGANALLLTGLRLVPGVVAFPFVNSGVILLATVCGVLLWRERPGFWGYAAIATAAPAIALMTLGT